MKIIFISALVWATTVLIIAAVIGLPLIVGTLAGVLTATVTAAKLGERKQRKAIR